MFASEGTVSRAEGAAVQRPVVGARLLEPPGFGEQGGGQVGRSGWGRGRKCNQRGLRTLRHVVRTRPPLCSDELLTTLQRPPPRPSSAQAAGFACLASSMQPKHLESSH